jgi:hypothetical protein
MLWEFYENKTVWNKKIWVLIFVFGGTNVIPMGKKKVLLTNTHGYHLHALPKLLVSELLSGRHELPWLRHLKCSWPEYCVFPFTGQFPGTFIGIMSSDM